MHRHHCNWNGVGDVQWCFQPLDIPSKIPTGSPKLWLVVSYTRTVFVTVTSHTHEEAQFVSQMQPESKNNKHEVEQL